jgi:hypothetical protein
MPTLVSPSRVGHGDHGRDDKSRRESPSVSLKLRMRVAVKRDTLTRELAQGADPTATPERALRASQLTSGRRRRQMIRTWRRAIAEARQPAVTRAMVGIINRRAVLEAEDAIQELIERLRSPDPVTAKGMAMAERIVTDGASSPLYNPSGRGTLRRLMLVATAELDAEPFELPIAA